MELILYISHRSYTSVRSSNLRNFLGNNQEPFSNFGSLRSVILESRLVLEPFFQFQFIYLPEKKKYIYTDIQYITKMLFKDYRDLNYE